MSETPTAGRTPDSPRVVLASLSGRSDAAWALQAAEYADVAILGGIALCDRSRRAAREMVADRDRTEFLPGDPIAFVDRHLERVRTASATRGLDLRPGFNLRSTETAPLRRAAEVCAGHDALCEINAHCRQEELCAVGCGEALLADTDRLCGFVATAADTGAEVSVKVRAEVPGADLAETARAIANSGADVIHVDAMDSEAVVGEVVEAAPELTVIANNGVRGRESVHEYLAHGADAVSVGRPSDDPAVLERVRRATEAFAEPSVSR